MEDGNLISVSLVNLIKHDVIASYPGTPIRGTDEMIDSGLVEVFDHSQKTKGHRNIQKLELEYHTVYYHKDPSCKIAVVVMLFEDSYPQRLVYKMIRDLSKELSVVGSLDQCISAEPWEFQSILEEPFSQIFDRYDRVMETDAVMKIQAKINQASGDVKVAMNKIIESSTNLEELQNRSMKLRNQSIKLNKDAGNLKKGGVHRMILVSASY